MIRDQRGKVLPQPKPLLLAVSLFACLLLPGPCLGQPAGTGVVIRSVVGTVSDIDRLGLHLTVKYFDVMRNSPDEITIQVPRDARVIIDRRPASFKDIRPGDQVQVEYYGALFCGWKAVIVTISAMPEKVRGALVFRSPREQTVP